MSVTSSAPPPLPDLLPTVLAVSLAAVLVVRPVDGAAPAPATDFTLDYLNPAGQQLTGLPEHPGGTVLTRWPAALAPALLACCQRAAARPPGAPVTTAADEHFRYAAQRHADALVVSFVAVAPAPPPAVPPADAARTALQQLIEQAPVAVTILRGPDLVIELANAAMTRLWGRPAEELVGRPHFEAMPETAGQGFEELLHEVLRTGQPLTITEAPARLDRAGSGLPTLAYVNFIFQPLYAAGQSAPTGIIAIGIEVTEQMLARRVAEATAQRLQLITDALPVLISYIDRAERYQFVNEAYRAWFGYDPASLIGQPVQAVVGDAAYATVGPHIARALAGERVDFEARMPYRADLVRYIRTSYVPDEQDGEIRGFYALVTDITEQAVARQQVEAANAELAARVREQTQELRATHAAAERQRGELERVFAQAPIAIAVYRGPTYIIELANPTVCRLWGRRQEDIIGKGLFEALPEVAGMGYEELLDRVMATGIPHVAHAMEAVHVRNGQRETVYWDFVYEPMYEADGSIYGAMVVATEATEQVRAQRRMEQINQELEVRVRERTQQLTEQQSLLSQVLRLVPASIATLSGPQHRYSFFNDQYQLLASNRAALGLTVVDVFPEVVEQGFVELLNNVYATGEPFVGIDTPVRLYDVATGQPEQRYVDFVYQPLTDEARRVQGILAFIVDVTDKVVARQQAQALNDELRVANDRLTRTNIDLDNFVYTASHDLRAPILNLDGLVPAVRDELATTPPGADLGLIVEQMQRTIERFQLTISHLTDIAQIQRADSEPLTPVSLPEVIEHVRLDLEPLYAAAAADLQIDVAGCPTVSFSQRNLRSVVYNLLSNAVKYRDPARRAEVRVSCEATPEYQVLRVQDNGLGLTPDQQVQLFTLFRRLHNHVDGAGIGLYMVKRIVENAGGRIEVASEVGVGTTFRIFFRR